MKVIKHDKGLEVNNQTEPFLLGAIQEYISRSNFPRKIEVKRIKATKVYYDEKIKQHEKLINKANNEIGIIGARADDTRGKCNKLLFNLKQHIV